MSHQNHNHAAARYETGLEGESASGARRCSNEQGQRLLSQRPLTKALNVTKRHEPRGLESKESKESPQCLQTGGRGPTCRTGPWHT